jgi:transcriptional regulator with XRE-family HTH domain
MTGLHQWQEWAKQIEASPEFAAEQAKLDLAVALERRMNQLGVNRAELARRLGTSPAAITMALRGDANLTIDRMVRMVYALDATLHIHVASKTSHVRWLEFHDGGRKDQLAHAGTWAKLKKGLLHGHPITSLAA